MSSSDLLNGSSSLIEYNSNSGTYTPDPTNKILTTNDTNNTNVLSYDLNGNITDDGKNLYTFNVENKLLSATNKTTNATKEYFYDAEDRLIKSLASSPSPLATVYVHSGDQIIEERDSSGALLQHNVFGLGIDDLLRTTKAEIKYYPLTNDQSSVLALTDVNGNVLQRYDYDSFGQVTVQDVNGDIVTDTPLINTLFQGREFDLETGLYYFRARYYSPELGRFISHDPMDYVDGMNMYEFVMGNPTTFVDPFGLMSDSADIGPGSVGFGIENEGALVDREIANQVISHAKANADTMEITKIVDDGGIESIPEQGPKEGDNIETNPIIEKTPEDTKFTTPITPQNPDDGKCITYIPPEDPTSGKLTTPILEKQPGDNIEKNESGSEVARETTGDVDNTHETASNKGYPGIKLTPQGNPDFSGTNYLYPIQDGQKNIVKIPLTGSRRKDFDDANKSAGLREKPKNYTWHHVDDYNPKSGEASLQLVHSKAHQATYNHKGSVWQYEQDKGVKYKR